jgi:tRNA threonylcarbamoyladenosine biosynthesis protein TsaE
MPTYTLTVKEAGVLAMELGPKLNGGEILALCGPLGAGKTTFTQALGKQLKVKHKITSPTFTLMHQYPGRLKDGTRIHLLHLDLYRTKNFTEIKALGLTDFWNDKSTITVIEWADKIKKYLPKKTIIIKFKSL